MSDGNAIVSLTNIKATFKSATVNVSGSEGYDAPAADENTGTTEEEVQIAFLVDAETLQSAYAVMTALYAPTPVVFVPEVLEYTVTPGLFGYDTVSVITSKDVASLTVNGKEAKKLNDSWLLGSMFTLIADFEDMLGTDFSSNDYYIWTVSSRHTDSYEITAYNADGLTSDPSVTDSASSITMDDINSFYDRSEIISIMVDLAEQFFTPRYFETYINERFDGRREIITQTSEDVEYIVVDGEIVDRYITETVVDLGNDGAETVKRVWITETDDTAEEEEPSVRAYDRKGFGSHERRADRMRGRK